MNKISLHFWGYTWDAFKGQIGDALGIVLVYKGKLESDGGTVMKELLYIDYGTINRIVISDIWLSIKSALTTSDIVFFSYTKFQNRLPMMF